MKPSQFNLATAKKTWWVPSSFLYVMIKGIAWSGNNNAIEKLNATEDNADRVHETIHIRQAVGTRDSWLKYYWTYICQWICNLPLITVKWHAAYKFMPMEIEAYMFENNPNYIKQDNVYNWKIIKEKYPLKKRRELAKMWYHKLRYIMTFNNFLNEFMAF